MAWSQTPCKIIKHEGKIVYLSKDTNSVVKSNMYFTTYKEETKLISHTSKTTQKEIIKTGTVRVIEIGPDYIKAKVIQNKGMAVRNLVKKAKFQTRFGVTAGYSMFQFSANVNTVPTTITPSFTSFVVPSVFYGAYIGLDISTIQEKPIGMHVLYNIFPSCGYMQGFSIDLAGYWKFFLPNTHDRIWIPIGIGVSTARLKYEYSYGAYLVPGSEPQDYMKKYFYGTTVFTGMRFEFSKLFHSYFTVGFRYMDANKDWFIRYNSGEKNDAFGFEVKDNYEVTNPGYRAIDDEKIIGLDLKAGISFVF